MLINFYYAKKSTIEASEKFAEALVKHLTNLTPNCVIKDAGKYSCTLFIPLLMIPHGLPETIHHLLGGKYKQACDLQGFGTMNFIGVSLSTGAVESLAKSYHNRGNTLFETLG